MRYTIVFLAIVALASPQGTPATENLLSGSVTDAQTHLPLEGVRVEATAPGFQVTSNTDSQGRYHIPNHFSPSGAHIFARFTRAGYISYNVPVQPPGIDLAMDAEATLSGRILDRDTGDPVEGLRINALAEHFDSGIKRLVPIGYGNKTGHDGLFRMQQLRAGAYILEIEADFKQSWRPLKPEEQTKPFPYSRSYYPGVPESFLATPVQIVAGEARNIEIQIAKSATRIVSGAIELPEPVAQELVSALLLRLEPGNYKEIAATSLELNGAGPFQLRGLSPGDYLLLAWTGLRPRTSGYMVDYRFTLGNQDLTDLKIPLTGCNPIQGSLHADQESGPLPEGAYTLYLAPTDRYALEIEQRGEALKAGRFSVCATTAQFRPVITGLPSGWRLSRFTIDAGSLDITVTRNLAKVSGTLRDSDSVPIVKARLVLVPEVIPDNTGRMPMNVPMVQSDAQGAYLFTGIIAGRYRIVPLVGDDARLWADAEFLRQKSVGRDVVEIAGGQSVTVQVRR